MGAPHCKAVVPSKSGPNMAVFFLELRGVNVKFLVLVFFSNPEKARPCAEPRCLTITRENRLRSLWAVGRWKNR